MPKYMITITTPLEDQTFSSVMVEMASNGVTASCPKESGVEITPVRDGPCQEFIVKLPHAGEELRLCLETRGLSVPSRELLGGEASTELKENYLI